MADNQTDWNPGTYARFRGLRLRPAIDLLAQVPVLPAGDVVDLGCGNGAVGAALKARLPDRRLLGIDTSATMLQAAAETGCYDKLSEQDAATWLPDTPPALIFSNALLHWLPDHATLLPKLAGLVAQGGVLAIQMPRQFGAPSHVLLRETAQSLFPDRFDYRDYIPPVAPPEFIANLLSGYGELNLWETNYIQPLSAVGKGHPVRRFTISTAARPILAKLSQTEQVIFLSAYDAALEQAYPTSPQSTVSFPFLRQFLVLTTSAASPKREAR